jgi:hypothetical protein
MNINQHNYEAYLLDYIEGRLNALEVLMLKEFIHKNPQLGDFDELTAELPLLVPTETDKFPNPDALKKNEIHAVGPIDASNAEWFFVAHYEGILEQSEQKDLQAFLKLNPCLQADFELYAQTIFVADTNIQYQNKSALKQHTILLSRTLYSGLSIAASLLLLIGLWWWWPADDIPERQTLASIAMSHKETGVLPVSPMETKTLSIQEVKTFNFPEPDFERLSEDVAMIPALAMRKASVIGTYDGSGPSQKLFHIPTTDYFDTEYNYAGLQTADEDENRSLAGLLLAKSGQAVKQLFNKQIVAPIMEEVSIDVEKRISLWHIAAVGVKSYNTLADRDVELTTAHNSDGEVIFYQFQSSRVAFSGPNERK